MRFLLSILLCLLLGACAATYKAADDSKAGYRDIQINKTTYLVEYTESAKTPWDQVHRFALKRCAEIAQQRGYLYFDVISKQEAVVHLESDVDSIVISTMGNIATDPPVTNTYATGGKVEGRRVTYEITLANE